jgi:DNA primase
MAFPEALKYLAERAGIKLKPRSGSRASGLGSREEADQDEGQTERERIAGANAKAVEFYRALLRHPEHGRAARAYIEKRRISPEMVEAFQLGYAADRWDGVASMIREKSWDLRGFLAAGLVSLRQRDNDSPTSPQSPAPSPQNCYDRLRHRLIFPIFDAIGRPIAFGGRKLRDEDEPKYLNSPETALFNKSATLYGLHLAKKPIIDSRAAVIVEGYTDVIACHQAGVRNVVATLGTALTGQHVTALRHYAEKVVLVYDGDEAGQKAADRAVEVFLTGSLDVFIAVLPEGLDPADLFEREDGHELWARSIDAATDALEFQFRRVREQLDAAETITGRQRLAEDYLRRLGAAGLESAGAIRRAMILQRLAGLLRLSESAVQDLLKRLAPAKRAAPTPLGTPATIEQPGGDKQDGNVSPDVAPAISAPKIRAFQQAERHVIGCLLRDPGLFSQTLADGRAVDEAVTPSDFVSPPAARLYERLYQRLSDGEAPTLARLLADLAEEGEPELADLATRCESEVEALTDADPDAVRTLFHDDANWILGYHRERQLDATREALAAVPAEPAAGEPEPALDERALRRFLEERRGNPSPARIARPRV